MNRHVIISTPRKYVKLVQLMCPIWWPLFISSVTLSRDNQTRKIQENITNVEKHFGEMCQLFSAYVRKTARLRDKSDVLVREIGVYADTETPHLKRGLKQFADHLAKIQDYRQAEVKRLHFSFCCFHFIHKCIIYSSHSLDVQPNRI